MLPPENLTLIKRKKIMNTEYILSKCDHTLLAQTAGLKDILAVCDDGMKYKTASVCIPPCFVKDCVNYVSEKGGNLKICTVIGFPNGYNAKSVKVFETEQAVKDGADEIDVVINIGMLKAGCDDYVLDELKAVRAACEGKILKVIIETCLLIEEEKLRACKIVSLSGADFIKTSTGFAGGGATIADVKLMRANVPASVKVKAAGGISGLEDAEEFLNSGADRLGTSRVVKAVKAAENK